MHGGVAAAWIPVGSNSRRKHARLAGCRDVAVTSRATAAHGNLGPP